MGNKSSQQDESPEPSTHDVPISRTNRSRTTSSASSATTATETSSTNIPAKQKPSYYQMVKQGYQELVNAIIRPPRCQYEVEQLGPMIFDFCGRTIHRTDFELINPHGARIVCSHWQPDEKSRPSAILPCVIYMHGNSSSRLESLPQLSLVLHIGATLLTFDFAGSGRSDGEFVSLGAFEKDDLQCVIEHLRECGTTSAIALWGRSMGAATALLHGERDPSIAGMILDSAFTDLESLAEELVDRGRQHGLYAPGFVVSIAIRFIRSSVQKSAGFDIKDLSPIAHADRCFIPALFIAAEGDAFVPPHHSKKIYEKYAGDKNIILVDGDHNSLRPRFMQDSVTIFLHNVLQIPEEWIIDEGTRLIGYLPWGSSKRYPKHAHSSKTQTTSSISSSSAALTTDNGIVDMGFGMTGARQAEIQTRLFQMAGQGNASDIAGSSISSTGSHTPVDVKIPRNQTIKPSSISGGVRISSADDLLDGGIIDHDWLISSDEIGEDAIVVEEEWTCETCTLINSEGTELCMACGIPRF